MPATLVNDTLFFMGGNYTFQGGGAQSITGISHLVQAQNLQLTNAEQQLYSLNLSTSFPVNGFLKDSFVHSTGSSQTQYVGGGAFFADANGTKLYSMAGYPDTANEGIDSLDAYDVQHDNWSAVSPGTAPLNKLNRGQAMFATTDSTGLGLGFIAGGMDWIPGMVIFNASDPNNLSWTNTTNDVPYFWGPATEYVRFGNMGVLVAVGGYTSIDNSEQRDMSAVQVYDIDSQQWFQVTATGDIPNTRSSFCSGLSSAPDDSSFQMTIYGGYSKGSGGKPSPGVIDDVYVLTMPAFQWIQIPSQGKSNVNVTSSRRHLCNTYRDRQMIVLGGDQSDAGGNTVGGCNVQYPPLKLLDTSTYSWQTTFPLANSTYEVPAQVYKIIGGDGSGSATLTAPAGGFNATIGNTAASAIFSKRVAKSQTSSLKNSLQSTSASTTNSSIPPVAASASATNLTGAIVGAVLGALVLIVGLAILLIILQRRRKATKVQTENASKWHKAELPNWPTSPRLVSQRPGGFKTHEIDGDYAETLKPKELAMGSSHGVGVMRVELDATSEPHAMAGKAFPELPGRFNDQ